MSIGNADRVVSQHGSTVVVKGDFRGLRAKLGELGVEEADVKELVAALDREPTIKNAETFGPNVGAWIGKMVQKAATGLWNVGVNTAANVLAILIAKYYGF